MYELLKQYINSSTEHKKYSINPYFYRIYKYILFDLSKNKNKRKFYV